MTVPSERTRAVLATRAFLEELCGGDEHMNVPRSVRETARQLLRHYPDAWHIDMAAVAWPTDWAPAVHTYPDRPSYLDLLQQLNGLSSTQAPDGSA